MAATSSTNSQKFFQIGERESRLFPLLQQIHALPNLPDLLKGLTFPESLLGGYEKGFLERSHPTFALLHRMIAALDRHLEFSSLLGDLRIIYDQLILEACSANDKKRWKLFKGPVRIFVLLNLEPTCFTLTQKRGRELLSGELTESTLFGSISIFCSQKLEIEPLERVHLFRRFLLKGAFPPPLPLLFIDNLFQERSRAHLVHTATRSSVSVLGGLFGFFSEPPKETFPSSSPLAEVKEWLILRLKELPVKKGALLLDLLVSTVPDLLKIETDQPLLHLIQSFESSKLIPLIAGDEGVLNQAEPKRGRSALHLAVQFGQVENVAALIAYGADINSIDNDGYTPLHLAVSQGNEQIFDLLIKKGANRDLLTYQKETLLHLAASQNNLTILNSLLLMPHSHLWINQSDLDGKTPLHRAVWGEPKPPHCRCPSEKRCSGQCSERL